MAAALCLAAGAIVLLPEYAFACGANDVVNCETDTNYATVGLLDRAALSRLPQFPGDKGSTVIDANDNRPRYEYLTLADCDEAIPGTPNQDVSCSKALRACPPETAGPLARVWRRAVLDGRVVEAWNSVGLTCHTEVAPGSRPTLTMADLKAAFMRTPWSKPQISSQPAGNTTLVNLRTFYKVNWSAAGFQPGEVDRSVLRGIPVQIRPKLVGFTYVFGDGSTVGPTASTGGVYPDGDITHVYRAKGKFPVRVDTTFGADFSIDGSTWDEIPSTVTVPGPSTTVTVREAKGVLVNR
ncbi:hypothetical protein GCM10009858_16720 [Terrabacter carboxydivorans]|uniref:PKD domain-containing protein n=2 Tax=Terrabacter carboxydivorans TaxID=619730 RepID=A0ABP5YJJ6_9MICO